MASSTISLEEAAGKTVGDVMIRKPKTLPADAVVGDIRLAFEHPKTRTVLLADGERFAGAIERGSLPDEAPDDAPATSYVEAEPLIAAPQMPMTEAIRMLERRDEPRLIVIDSDGVTLLGLLCGNNTATGFCLH